MSRTFASFVLLAALSLTACQRQTPESSTVQTTAAEAVEGFALLTATAESHEGRPAALLTFSQALAGAQKFDELLSIALKDGAIVAGAWALDSDNKRLRFPYLDANKNYVVTLKPGLAAATGEIVGKGLTVEVYTGPLEPLL